LRAEGALQFHGRIESWRNPAVWERTLGALRGRKWIVFGKGSVAGPESVLEYLGRYTHRVAISNGRLVRVDERTVTFRYKDYRDASTLKEMTLDGVEFVRRLSLHILPPGFTKIRHYGILGNNRRATLVPLARQALERSPWRLDSAPVTPTPLPRPEARGAHAVAAMRSSASGDSTPADASPNCAAAPCDCASSPASHRQSRTVREWP
jgi:hypothetical protein